MSRARRRGLSREAWELLHRIAAGSERLGDLRHLQELTRVQMVEPEPRTYAVRPGSTATPGGYRLTERGRYALAHEADMRRAPAGGAS